MGARGVLFLTNSEGEKVAVQLDLSVWAEVWEDIYDGMIAKEREDEPTEPWETVKERLRAEGKLDG
ncbi:MAG: hypothetical protein WCF57_05765 [Pyrinomonadaceae bacterium]